MELCIYCETLDHELKEATRIIQGHPLCTKHIEELQNHDAQEHTLQPYIDHIENLLIQRKRGHIDNVELLVCMQLIDSTKRMPSEKFRKKTCPQISLLWKWTRSFIVINYDQNSCTKRGLT